MGDETVTAADEKLAVEGLSLVLLDKKEGREVDDDDVMKDWLGGDGWPEVGMPRKETQQRKDRAPLALRKAS